MQTQMKKMMKTEEQRSAGGSSQKAAARRVRAAARAACSSARARASRTERAAETRAHSPPQRPMPRHSQSRGARCAPRAQRPKNAAPTLMQPPAVPEAKLFIDHKSIAICNAHSTSKFARCSRTVMEIQIKVFVFRKFVMICY